MEVDVLLLGKETIKSYIEHKRFPAKRDNAYTAACYCKLYRDEELTLKKFSDII